MAGNTSFDEILTTTLNNYVPKLTDNIFSARPLFYALTNGQTMRTVSGGAKIVVPIIYKANDTAKSYAGTETIDVTAQTGITAAEYSWGQYAATVTINGLEEAQNNGEAQIIDLLEGKIFQTQESIIENMNTMFHGDGTTKATDWNGLENIVNDSALTANALGGIDPSVTGNEFWKSQATTTTGALTLAKLATRYNSVSVGNDQPTIIISKADDYESYEALLTSNIRYTDTDMADAGFQNLMYKGAPWTFDAATTDGVVYMLNTKYLQLVRHSDTWFKPTPFVRPNDKDAVFSQILCYGQLTCSNRDRQGYLEGVT
tara:strand:+ start:4294 stop:5241 length:948 start_codon:yes stop_codon:yes gene_type:complete